MIQMTHKEDLEEMVLTMTFLMTMMHLEDLDLAQNLIPMIPTIARDQAMMPMILNLVARVQDMTQMIQTLVARVQGMIQVIQTQVARVQDMIQMIQTLVARVQVMIQMEEKVLDLVKIIQILWAEEDPRIGMEEVLTMMKIPDEKIPRTGMVLI